MATFTKHFPNAMDPTVGYSSAVAWCNGVAANRKCAWGGSTVIGEGEASDNYRYYTYNVSNAPGTEAPYIEFQWRGFASGDIVAMRFHWNDAVAGTLDPLSLFDPNTGALHLNTSAANVEPVVAQSGNSFVEGWAEHLVLAVEASTLCNGDFLNNAAALVIGSDGPRADLPVGVWHRFDYNPTSAEDTAGVQPLVVSTVWAFSDGATEGINIVGAGGLPSNTVNETVPVVINTGSSSESAWNDLQSNVTAISAVLNEISILNVNNVTHVDDLGETDPPAAEPDPGDVDVQVYGNVGALPALVSNPAAQAALTTVPAIVVTAMGTLGNFLAGLNAAGVPAALPSALSALADLNQLSRIADALESIDASLVDVETSITAVSLDTERLCNLFGAPQGEPEPDALMLEALTDTMHELRNLAETRQDVTLRARGVEVEVLTGAVSYE